MRKIAFLMTRKAQYQTKIIDSFETLLKELLDDEPFESIFFETQSLEEEKITSQIDLTIEKNPNLIVIVGAQILAITTKLYTPNKLNNIPLLSASGGKPRNTKKANALRKIMTGASHKAPSPVAPAQAILGSQPNIENFFIVYRKNLISGNRSYRDAVKLKQFIRECKKRATLVPFDSMPPTEALAKKNPTPGSAVIAPVASILASESDNLAKYCKKNKLQSFIDADGAMPKGILWGYSSEVEEVGFKLAEYAYEILINNTPVADLPWLLLDNPARPVFDPAALPKGVAPPGDEVVFDNDTGRHLCYVKHNYAYLALWNSVLDNKLFASLGKHGQPNASGVEANARYFDGWPANKQFTSDQLTQTIQSDEEVIVVYGQHATKLLQEKMLELNTFKKMLTIRPADDCNMPMPADSAAAWPKNQKFSPSTMIIPAYEADRLASIISFMWPHATSISIAHAVGENEERPRVLTERLIRFREVFKRRGVGVNDFGSWDVKELMHMAYEEATKSDVMTWFPDLMRPLDAAEYKDWAEHHAAYVAGGDRDSLNEMHVSYSYETDILSARIFVILLEYLQKKTMPAVIDLSDDKALMQVECNTRRCDRDDNEWHQGLTALLELRQEPLEGKAAPERRNHARADRYSD